MLTVVPLVGGKCGVSCQPASRGESDLGHMQTVWLELVGVSTVLQVADRCAEWRVIIVEDEVVKTCNRSSGSGRHVGECGWLTARREVSIWNEFVFVALASRLSEVVPDDPEHEERERRAAEEDVHVLRPGNYQHKSTASCTHVLLSTQEIVSRLRPRVLAAPSSLVRAPLSMPRCSTRLVSTACPCARYWSRLFSVSRINVCSLSA